MGNTFLLYEHGEGNRPTTSEGKDSMVATHHVEPTHPRGSEALGPLDHIETL
jgi:hypothetical protein